MNSGEEGPGTRYFGGGKELSEPKPIEFPGCPGLLGDHGFVVAGDETTIVEEVGKCGISHPVPGDKRKPALRIMQGNGESASNIVEK